MNVLHFALARAAVAGSFPLVAQASPDPPPRMPHDAVSIPNHRLREDRMVRAKSILGGLHHEYFWAPADAR
jgi:hypothetical protein